MNNSHSGAAAVETIDAEIMENESTDLQVSRQPAAIAHRTELTPESLKAEIERQTQLRAIMTDYVRSAMVEGHHYYSFNKLGKGETNSNIKADKPALTQDGAYLICGLFKVTPGQPKIDITREEGGHFTVIAEVPFFNLEGGLIATGNGSCSTRESKYAYRWVYERDVPADLDKTQLQTRSGRDWKQYRLPNADLADQENTVMKMAIKRATVGGVRKLPLVSELFATDPSGDDRDDRAPAAGKAKTTAKQKPLAETVPAVPQSIAKAVDLAKKLVADHGVEPEELALQFLPEGVESFDKLNELQAAAVVPSLVELLNAKVKGE